MMAMVFMHIFRGGVSGFVSSLFRREVQNEDVQSLLTIPKHSLHFSSIDALLLPESMGISGLLPLLKPATKKKHIAAYRGQKLAVDGYAWLHRAAHSCCVELTTGVPTTKWINYILEYVDMLLEHQIIPFLVFDGDELPAKKITEEQRATGRATNLKAGREALAKKDYANARIYLAKAVEITPRMAAELIQVLKEHRPTVEYVVAPYEADAQLSFLCRSGQVDGVIAEDSDTIPYGCKEVLFKLQRDGTCEGITLSDIHAIPIPGFDLQSFDEDMMITLCVGAGCDYFDGVHGFGIKNSHKFVTKHRTVQRMLRAMKLTGPSITFSE